MNSNRRVLQFIIYSTLILLIVSIADYFIDIKWPAFKKINLIADVVETPAQDSIPATDTTIDSPPIIIEEKPKEDFSLYTKARFITDFNADTSSVSVRRFIQKLYELKTGKQKKIRIAYFGDSMIEGDLLTQTLRKLLQQTFGGNGVGFVPITSQVAKFRQTAIADYSPEWQDENFKTGNKNRLYLSGHLFRTNSGWVQIKDKTIPNDSVLLEKSLIIGHTNAPITINVNNKLIAVNGNALCNRIVIANDKSTTVKVGVASEHLPVYGISFESESGVIVDNFSFRGITGIEYASIDSSFLAAIAEANPYDLIVFQYGVNLLFRPNDKNFSWYARNMLPVIQKLKHCFEQSEFLLVSCADRAFSYNGEYQSAIGIDSLIKTQATLAYQTGSNFYNQFASMGGKNSIVEWANQKPSLANKDYVHPNHKGAEILANYLFEAIMNEYRKYSSTN